MTRIPGISVLCLAAICLSEAHAQTCRWDGTAPWCAGECGRGETEALRTSDLPPHWKEAFPIVQNTNFGAACVFGSKALCCPAAAGSECRWDGTAPFCEGSCGPGEVEGTPPPELPSGAACWTGSKKYCCRARTGSGSQALGTNPNLSLFAAIWEKSSGPHWRARHGLSGTQYQQLFNQAVADGYRPIEVSGYSVGGQARYAALFEKRSGPEFFAVHGLLSAEYQSEFERLTRSGFKPVYVDGFTVANSARLNAVFEKASSPAWVARHDLDSAAYQREFDRLTRAGYRLICVSGYNVAGRDLFAAIWEQRPSVPWVARHGLTSVQYQQEFDHLGREGYRVIRVSAWNSNREPRFAAIWEKEKTGVPAWQARHRLLADTYQEEFDRLLSEGYRLKDVNAYHMYE